MTAVSGWSNEAVKNAEAVMNDGGSIFPDLEGNARKITGDIIIGQVYKLNRFEVLRKTQNHDEPFVILELNDGALYSGYARALGNQLISMTTFAAKDPVNEAFVNDRKAWTEISTNIPVIFVKNTSPKGAYLAMEFPTEETAPAAPAK